MIFAQKSTILIVTLKFLNFFNYLDLNSQGFVNSVFQMLKIVLLGV